MAGQVASRQEEGSDDAATGPPPQLLSPRLTEPARLDSMDGSEPEETDEIVPETPPRAVRKASAASSSSGDRDSSDGEGAERGYYDSCGEFDELLSGARRAGGDRGEARRGSWLRRGRGEGGTPLKQRLENLLVELRRRQELFQLKQQRIKRQASEAPSRIVKQATDASRRVNQQLKSKLQAQQERLVGSQSRLIVRGEKMMARLQTGRSRAWRHKVIYALVQADFVVSAFWIGRSPETFHLYYTAQMAVIMGSKFIDYSVKRDHYFLLDFCFFANFTLLLWLWVFPSWGTLFNVVEGFCGLLSISVVVFRNSCVPHDFVRISNAYIHYPAVVCMLAVKMRCEGEICAGIEAGAAIDWYVRLRDAWCGYMTWASLYASVIFLIAKKRIDRKKRDTLYSYFAIGLGYQAKLSEKLQPYAGCVFMAGHQAMFLAGVWYILFPFSVQALCTVGMLGVFFHNGGRFYVDYFWTAYERNTSQYIDRACSVMNKEADAGGAVPVRGEDVAEGETKSPH